MDRHSWLTQRFEERSSWIGWVDPRSGCQAVTGDLDPCDPRVRDVKAITLRAGSRCAERQARPAAVLIPNGEFRHRHAKFRSSLRPPARSGQNITVFCVSRFSGWRRSCPYGWRASRVSNSSLVDRADAGSWAKRQPAVQGLVSGRDVRGVPASGIHDVP